jgi:hypothetical protein
MEAFSIDKAHINNNAKIGCCGLFLRAHLKNLCSIFFKRT